MNLLIERFAEVDRFNLAVKAGARLVVAVFVVKLECQRPGFGSFKR